MKTLAFALQKLPKTSLIGQMVDKTSSNVRENKDRAQERNLCSSLEFKPGKLFTHAGNLVRVKGAFMDGSNNLHLMLVDERLKKLKIINLEKEKFSINTR